MSLSELVVLILASGQVIETWRHGSLFAGARAWLEASADRPFEGFVSHLGKWLTTPRLWLDAVQSARVQAGFFVSDLLRCMFCLSHWSAAILVVWYGLGSPAGAGADYWARAVIYALAVTRGAQLLNDLAHPFSRTPR